MYSVHCSVWKLGLLLIRMLRKICLKLNETLIETINQFGIKWENLFWAYSHPLKLKSSLDTYSKINRKANEFLVLYSISHLFLSLRTEPNTFQLFFNAWTESAQTYNELTQFHDCK